MSRTKIVEKDAVTVGKTLADAVAVELDNVAGTEFFVPAGSELASKPINMHSLGPDGAYYVARSSLTKAQITLTLAAGESEDLDPAANVRATVKFVCPTLTPDEATAYVRGKRQT